MPVAQYLYLTDMHENAMIRALYWVWKKMKGDACRSLVGEHAARRPIGMPGIRLQDIKKLILEVGGEYNRLMFVSGGGLWY
jgi:hypothetical protein